MILLLHKMLRAVFRRCEDVAKHREAPQWGATPPRTKLINLTYSQIYGLRGHTYMKQMIEVIADL